MRACSRTQNENKTNYLMNSCLCLVLSAINFRFVGAVAPAAAAVHINPSASLQNLLGSGAFS